MTLTASDIFTRGTVYVAFGVVQLLKATKRDKQVNFVTVKHNMHL